ncbi:MAG: hypothetical protein AAF652_19695 [Cyanobacteria bacterium P01_C01_bin.72]
MNKEPETRYFDFIHQHEAKLNLIYRRWEAQIANQAAANASKELFREKLLKKKAWAGMAITLGSILVGWQYGSDKLAAWQQHRQLKSTRNLIAANAQKIDQIALELRHSAAYNNRLLCVQSGDMYQLSLGRDNNRALANQPRSFITQSNTVTLMRNSILTQRPDAYLRLNPNRNLLFGLVEETNNELKTEAYVIDLDQEAADLPLDSEAINNYAQAQSGALSLHEELSSCLGNIGLRPHIPRFPYAD